MLIYIQVSTVPEIQMAVNQWENVCNNPRLVHEHTIIPRLHVYICGITRHTSTVNHTQRSVKAQYRKKLSNVTYIPTLLVDGLNQMLIIQRMSCHVRDIYELK